MIFSTRLILLFLPMALLLPPAAQGATGEVRLSRKFHFLGFVGYETRDSLISLNFRFTVRRNGSVSGHVTRATTVIRKNVSVLESIEDVCRLRGRLGGQRRFKPGILRSGIALRGSNGGVIWGRVWLAAGPQGVFEAHTPTPTLFGLEKTETTIGILRPAPVLTIPPTPTPFPTPIPVP